VPASLQQRIDEHGKKISTGKTLHFIDLLAGLDRIAGGGCGIIQAAAIFIRMTRFSSSAATLAWNKRLLSIE